MLSKTRPALVLALAAASLAACDAATDAYLDDAADRLTNDDPTYTFDAPQFAADYYAADALWEYTTKLTSGRTRRAFGLEMGKHLRNCLQNECNDVSLSQMCDTVWTRFKGGRKGAGARWVMTTCVPEAFDACSLLLADPALAAQRIQAVEGAL